MKQISYDGYKDRWGMVTVNGVPNTPAEDSENGLLFTVEAIVSQELNGIEISFDFRKLFDACFIDGILYRSPEPHPKPESHDNWMACCLGALVTGDKTIARKLLLSYIKHFGYINKEWIIRFLQIPIMLIPISFPILKWVFLPPLYLFYKLQKPNIQNSNSMQLQFVAVSIVDRLYPCFKFLRNWLTKFSTYGTMYEVFKSYLGLKHPTTLIWKEGTE